MGTIRPKSRQATNQIGSQRLRLAPLSRSRVHNGRLIVLACSETKSSAPGRIPSYERYDGPLWRTLRAADPVACRATVAFLSARHGFRSASDCSMEAYDARLTAHLAERLIAGGVTAPWPERKSRRDGMSHGSHPAYEIASLTGYGERPFDDVALVGGHLYLGVMRSFVEGFRNLGHITKTARIVEINGSIGCMRKMLRTWLGETRKCSSGHNEMVEATADVDTNGPGPSP